MSCHERNILINILQLLIKNKYIRNSGWLLFERAVKLLLGLFIGIWVARYLGPEKFGMLNYAQSFVGLFSVIATLGLDGIVIKELIKNRNKSEEILGTSFVLKILGSIGVFFCIYIAIHFTSNTSYINRVIFIIASTTIFQAFNIIDFFFSSKVLSRYVVLSNIISITISSIIKLILVLNHASLICFVYTIVLESVLLSCGLIFFFIKKSYVNIKKFSFNKKLAFDLLNESWPLILAGITSLINMRIDQVMIGNMTNFNEVGNYSAAVKLSEIWFLIPGVIGPSIYPIIISSKDKKNKKYEKNVIKTIVCMAIFAVPFASIVSLLSGQIISLVYGKHYLNAASFLAIHIWSGVPYLTLFVYSQVAMIEKKTKTVLYTSVYAVVANISLNYFFIPHYGGVGAASVTAFVAWTSTLFNFFLIEKRVRILSNWRH